jgi:serine/threonine protein phosphatase PrpC
MFKRWSAAAATVASVKPVATPAELVRPRDDELDLFGITHRGLVRTDNQDHFLVCTVHPQVVVHATSLPSIAELPLRGSRLATILVVADGVGGVSAGSEAAQLATESVMRYVASTLRCYHTAGSASEGELLDALKRAVFEAHDAVRAEAMSRTERARMATTLTVGMAVWPWFYVVQVGDSRCYWWDGSTLRQVTRDQTLAQDLVDSGVLPSERIGVSPFKNVLASAIGGDEPQPVVTRLDFRNIAVDRGYIGPVLLCTDGLTRHAGDDEIAARIRDMKSCEQLCRDLLALALERGGTDNITVVAGRAPAKR